LAVHRIRQDLEARNALDLAILEGTVVRGWPEINRPFLSE